MSGGFFRGTSADQDTRFSNKQAKLLKTQKFAPELDHPVNMKKVNLDVMRPWIATRVTELLGFEDEVLINFVNGLLEAGEVDGKKVQIQLTGFMEKNTGKFMKELWHLLLSAQNNVSGVPQQFLDAKEEETRKKKAETDRIVQEIQKRREKEGRGLEQEKHNRKGIEADTSRSGKAAPDSGSKHSQPRTTEEKSDGKRRQSSRMKSRHSDSPYSSDHLLVSHRGTSSPDRSSGKSFSKSRSYSQDGVKSRSGSISSKSQRRSASLQRRHYSPLRGHSDSPERPNRSSRRCSISPRRRRLSPNLRSHLRQRSPLLRRRSTSRSRCRSPSPIRWRSPHLRRRSPSPHRRPLSQMRRRSPSLPHHRSLSPRRRRSPVQRKSPSPLRRRSPSRRRPLSPARHRSQTPLRRRSPPRRSPMQRRRSPQPSPKTHAVEVSLRQRNRSRSLDRNQSPSHQTLRRSSGEGDRCINGVQSGKHQDEHVPEKEGVKRSPDHHFTGQDAGGHPGPGRKVSDSVSRQLRTSLSSSQHDLKLQRDIVPVLTQEKSSNRSAHERNINLMKNRRSLSLSRSPEKQNRKTISHHDSPQTRMEEEKAIHAREDAHHRADYSHKRSKHSFVEASRKKFVNSETSLDIHSLDRSAVGLSLIGRIHPVKLESRRKEPELRSDMDFPERNQRVSPTSEGKEYGPRMFNVESDSMDDVHDRHCTKRKSARNASSWKEKQSNEQALKSSARDTHSRSEDDEHRESHFHEEYVKKSKHKVDKMNQSNNIDIDSEDKEKQGHKKSENHKRGLDGNTEYDSQMDDRKEAKRIRKDAKRQRKEERCRRREERHRRRLERRAGKLEPMSMDTVTPPPDLEKNHNDANGIDGDIAMHGDSYPSDTEETGTEQKKLEIELRKKALKSLRVKKAINP